MDIARAGDEEQRKEPKSGGRGVKREGSDRARKRKSD
jgi:hypothetical protein